MKWRLLVLTALALMLNAFGICTHAAVQDCDFSEPKDMDIDGSDLAQFIAHYSAAPPGLAADVNGDGSIDSNDAAHLAGFFGQTYTVSARRPNILLIVSDDVGLDVTTGMYPDLITDLLALYGLEEGDADYLKVKGTPASTPKLDTLAQEGMVFSNAWAQPFCSPTRASIMTGLFAAEHGIITYQDPLNSNHTTFVQLLKNSGYSTAAFGKWHLAGLGSYPGMKPKQAGFELYKGGLGAAPGSYWHINQTTTYEYFVQDGTTEDDEWYPGNKEPRVLDGIGPTTYLPVVKAADTTEWINARQADDPDKPWFAYLAFNLSHATSAFQNSMVVPDQDTLDCHPTDSDLDGPACREIKQCGGTFGSTSRGSCNGEQLMRVMTTSMDTVIGKVLETVASIPSDTYVIYIGDNGTPMYTNLGDLGSQIGNMYITRTGRGKGTAYESGARVGMAIKGPGISPNGNSSEFVHAADLFSTILELAGLTPPEEVPNSDGQNTPLDSISLVPLLDGIASSIRYPDTGYILTEAQNLMVTGQPIVVGARNATYKVICKDGTSTSDCEFYHLENDPLEEHKLDAYETSSCSSVVTGTPEWHYCHLVDVINKYSILKNPS